ncbi:MAG TPA: PKD domain-containing protein, partial [Bacteroidia bacterium]|nr:PKD domain-containing protein [Bacteroidia bacterium]
GLVLAIFKKAGSVIGGAQIKLDTAKYYKLYTMSFALLLTPDTIVFGGVSSLGAINGKRGIPGSVLTIDSVTYTGGVSQPAELNGDFENWQSDSLALPQGWQFANSGTISNYQTTDKYTGKYALEIQTTSQNSNGKDSAVTAEATTGQETGFGVAGGVPFTNKIDTLELYYKYAAANVNDSAQVTVELKKSGTMIYMRDTLIGASASYKRIRLPFNSPSVPDSVIVRLNSSKKWRQALSYVGATLKTDNIRFTSQAVAPVAGFKGGNVVCVGSTINYTDTTQNSPTTWSWTFGGGGTPNISGSQNPSIVYNSAGTYTTKLVVTNSAGSDSAMQTITVVTTPTVVVTGNTSICPGGNTVLTGTGASTYAWSTTSTNDTIHVAPAATATYSVTGTAIGGCSGTATVTVTVNPTPTITATATPTLVCQGNPTTLTASGATTYSWSTGATTSSANASPAAATTYTVTGTSSFGCMGTQTVSVAVNASPTLMVSGKTPICSGTHDTLRVIDTAGDAGFLKYKWNTGATTNQISGKLTSTSTFTVVITDGNGCKDSAIQKITVHTNPTVTMSGNVFGGFTICSGNIDSLHAKATGGSGVYNYKWTTTGTNDTALVKTAGTYSVLVTDGNGCTYAGSTSVVVKVNATPTLTAYATTPSFCDGNSTPLNCTGATTYTWLPATNLSASTGSPVTATPTVSVTYTVTGTTTGCSSSKKVPV